MSTENSFEEQKDKALSQDAVIRRLFSVTFLGADEYGYIVKSIEVMAESSDEAMDLVSQVSKSSEIYSALEI